MRASSIRKLWSHRCRTSKITTNAQIDQNKLLVARNQREYQEVCLKIHEILAEQGIIYKESWRTSSIGNT